MKYYIKLILLLYFFTPCNAQTYFNKSYFEGQGKLVFCDLKPINNNKLITSGFSRINNVTNDPSGHITFLDSLGNTIQFCTYIGKILDNSTWWDENLLMNNSNEFIVVGNTSRNDSIFATVFITDTLCNILKKTEFTSLYIKNNKFLTPFCIIKDGNGGYFCASSISNTPPPDLDLQITKLDSALNILWSKSFGIKGKSDIISAIMLTPQKNVKAYGVLNYGEFPQNNNELILDIDSNGNLINTIVTPDADSIYYSSDCIYEPKDSSYIFASHLPQIAPTLYTNFYPILYKRDKNNNILWKTKMGNGQYGNTSIAERVIKAIENDGYIMVGSLNRIDFNDKYIDRNYGFIGKIGLNGDSLWLRQYAHINDKKDSITFGDGFYDIINLNNSYYLCGDVFGPLPNQGLSGNLQAGWFMRVDKYGCLIPGCHLPTSLPILDESAIHYKIYPNPTQDEINIFMDDTNGKELTIKICDLNGIPIQSINHNGTAISYILPIHSYTTGVYFIQFWEKNKLLKTEQFVKQ